MNEIRCPKCNKKLFESPHDCYIADEGQIHIQCHRCKDLLKIKIDK